MTAVGTRWAKPKPKFGQQVPKQQLSVFDQAERKKQEGMEVSYRNADSIWKESAKERIRWLAANTTEFTSDDVIEYLDAKGITTSNNSALGAIFQAAARVGLIQPTSNFRESLRPSRHQAPIKVWRSNITKGGSKDAK